MGARLPLAALASLLSAAVAAQVEREPIPRPELQLLSEVVRLIKRDFAGATDDAVLASGCADAVASQSGTNERAAKSLEAIPPLLMRAKAAAPVEATYRKLAYACIEGMVGLLDLHSKFLSEAEFRALYRSTPAGPRTPTVHAQWSDGDVLQLRILRFSEATRADMLREMAALPGGATREPRGVVLDLRDNSGGTLLSAVDASGLFLADGAEVGSTHGRGAALINSYRASERAGYPYGPAAPERVARALKNAPLAVLVNEHTAAGAEILAAALQRNGRARLVGASTLGRGSVQTLFPLSGGAALRITTAYWHLPRDAQLDGKPLEPDVRATPEGAMRAALRALAEARK